MKIRKLDYGKAFETWGQIGNWNFIGVDLKPVAFDKQRIAGYQCPDSPENAVFDELSSIHGPGKNILKILLILSKRLIENKNPIPIKKLRKSQSTLVRDSV